MPDRQDPPGGWVLYLDGHTEWVPYPGKFPMSRRVIEKARALKGEPRIPSRSTYPGWRFLAPKSLYPDTRLGGILNSLYGLGTDILAYNAPIRKYSVNSYEFLNDSQKLHVVFDKMELLIAPPEFSINATKLDEIFPTIVPDWERRYLGIGEGFSWYGYGTPESLDDILRWFRITETGEVPTLTAANGKILTVYEDSGETLEHLKEIWLSNDSNAKSGAALLGLWLLATPEATKVIHEGLKPEHPAYFRNLQTIVHWHTGINTHSFQNDLFNQFYLALNFSQRFQLLTEIESRRIYRDEYRPLSYSLMLMQGHPIDKISEAVKNYQGDEQSVKGLLRFLNYLKTNPNALKPD
jgi:hypothetical protein